MLITINRLIRQNKPITPTIFTISQKIRLEQINGKNGVLETKNDVS